MTALPLRILYVLPYVPSPVRVRPYELIRALARAGHYVTVAALADDFASAESLAELRRVCRAVHVVPHPKRQGMAQAALALFTPTPLWAAFCYSPAMHTRLRDLIATEPFDVAHVEHLRAAHFAPALAPLPLVFDAVDCVTALQKQLLAASGSPVSRLLAWEEWHKLRAYEPKVCRVFARITITSAHDAADLRGLDPALPPITVIPNGVDSAYFAPDPSVAPEPDMLIFSGKMSYAPNDDAARFLLTQILPPLRRLRPGVRVIVGGSKPSAALKRLAARTPGVP